MTSQNKECCIGNVEQYAMGELRVYKIWWKE